MHINCKFAHEMKLKGKISILLCLIVSLSFMLGDKADVFSSDCSECSSEDLLYVDSSDDSGIRTGHFSFSTPETQCRVPRQSGVSNHTRTLSQAKRHNPTNLSRNGFTLSKSGKSMNSYTTSLFFTTLYKFPSGLAETSHHLIYLGKLII